MKLKLERLLMTLCLASVVLRSDAAPTTIEYIGACDASAVVPVDQRLFAVADDEDNVLRVYARNEGGAALHTIDLSRFLVLGARKGETDLEDAARVGDLVFWISSHGRNANGKFQPSRHRFFATTASVSNGVVDLQPVGRPYSQLLNDLIRDPRMNRFNLAAASRLAPKSAGALNIEGLCATPEGHLLIGFRNPLPERKALVVRLLNPGGVIKGESARFGDPLLLDLGGLGIRGMVQHDQAYLLIAGSFDGQGSSKLFEWDGAAAPRPVQNANLNELNPEAIASFPGETGSEVLVLSDDGTVQVDCVDCKKLKDSRKKRFRGLNLKVSLDGRPDIESMAAVDGKNFVVIESAE